MDLSPTALARAQARREWPDRVRFAQFDLRRDSLPGGFDLIVIAAVLEYMPNPLTLYRVRRKLVDALRSGGYLMVETTRQTGVTALLERSWWSSWLLRGKWINQFVTKHPLLRPVCSIETDGYVIALCRKGGLGSRL
jgi:2-polyprenyl-3-methyl-5-hydroxy-6-metoxy-1,4-benzoquinol methylase